MSKDGKYELKDDKQTLTELEFPDYKKIKLVDQMIALKDKRYYNKELVKIVHPIQDN